MDQPDHRPSADHADDTRPPAPATFGEAFREALKASGLSLQRLHHHLGERGVAVSPVTLSHWQRGRSQPERHESLRAVAELETILDVPRGALQSLLAHRRPRGRAVTGTSEMSEAWSRILSPGAPLERALGADAYRFNEHLVTLSVQETVRVDAQGCIARYTVSHVVRATHDGVRHLTAHHNLDDLETPSVQVNVHCGRLETLRFRQEFGSAVFDIGFGRVLRRGETAIVDYTLDVGPRWKPSTHHERTLPVPVRQYLLHIFFHPRRLPSAVYGYYRDASGAERQDLRPLALDASHSVHVLPAKCGAGIHGIAWRTGHSPH
ncbi:helix-turn-helix domain-containing protein [Streptomyces sp. LP11]|uniref:Helix-turn-helix domain-containing protein n=1 Tax=Streptomyces pyxinicus TaxID=2970331 RepID=A0ABT2B4E3_9ACTN|nr:helix-turn-helix transcriptional regulator [Streptomyces sp. LP11]MCS0603386.1 helix-turn-helix domain-containing protein [Streptomyces sp. LP11]